MTQIPEHKNVPIQKKKKKKKKRKIREEMKERMLKIEDLKGKLRIENRSSQDTWWTS